MELLFALELLFIMFELLFELLVTKIVLSWSNAPYQRCSSGTYGIGMVQCSVPKVLEYARRAVTVRRAENRVQCSSNVVGLQCGQWCRTVRPVLDGVGRFSSMRDGL